MKKIIYSFLTVLLAASCIEETFVEQAPKLQTITVSTGMGIGSRAGVSDAGSFTWHADDAISVMATDGKYYTMTLTDGAGTKQAEFTGSFPEGVSITTVATYPATVDNGTVSNIYNEGTLTYTLPSEYTYKDGYANVPMISTFETAAESLPFMHIGALVRISLNGMPANSKILVSAKNRKITGDFTMSTDKVGTPDGVIATQTIEGNDVVTINYTNERAGGTAEINVPLPVGVYDELTVSIQDNSNNEVFTKTWSLKNKEFKRANLLVMQPERVGPMVKNIPRHPDMKGAVISTSREYSFVELDFEVFPKNLLSEIAHNLTENLKLEVVNPTVKSSEIFNLPIIQATADAEKGTLIVRAKCKDLNESFFAGDEEAIVSLVLNAEGNNITSENISITRAYRKPHNSNHSPKIVAHRGYWNTTGSAQNSITALRKANETGVWGCELDLWMTTDNVLVLNHDGVIDNIAIQYSPYSAIKNCKLSNGEILPTFEQYLQVFKNECTDLILIIELKPHYSAEVTINAIHEIIKMVDKYELADLVEYISFSPVACDAIVRYAPTARVAYLESDMTPLQCIERGYSGIDFHYSTYQNNPTYVKDAHNYGMEVNAWTVNYEGIAYPMQRTYKVDILTTDKPVDCLNWIK